MCAHELVVAVAVVRNGAHVRRGRNGHVMMDYASRYTICLLLLTMVRNRGDGHSWWCGLWILHAEVLIGGLLDCIGLECDR